MISENLYHYMYMITHILTGKIYIGIRSSRCSPEEDTGYMGSGSALKDIDRSLLLKTILSEFPSRENAIIAEMLIVNENFCLREETLNIRTGGERGFIVDRSNVIQGIERAKERGVYKGRQCEIDYDEIYKLTDAGYTQTESAKQMGISRMSVYRALKKRRNEK